MGKKRKTREQKIIARLRHQLSLNQSLEGGRKEKDLEKTPPLNQNTAGQSQSEKLSEKSFATQLEKLPTFTSNQEKSISLLSKTSYAYLASDLKKVGILTGLAILLQTVLYLALR